jgi:regulator of sigma D
MTPQPICTRVHTQLRGDELRNFAHTLVDIFESGVFEKYMQAARDVASACNVPLCDCYAKWKKLYEGGVDITSLLSNYLNHPTRDMHWLFATSLVETMSQ